MVVVVVVVVSSNKSERCVVVARDSAVVSTHEKAGIGGEWGTGDGAWADGVPSKR